MKLLPKILLRDESTQIDEAYIADSKAALLNKNNPYARIILYSIILFVIALLFWAGFARIDVISVAEGKVVPATQVKQIQSLDGGIIKEILVKEGDLVKKDQSLLLLDDTRYAADYNNGYNKYLALSAMVARLFAEANNYEKIDFPAEVRDKQPELVARENSLFLANKEGLEKEVSVLEQTLNLAQNEIKMYEPLVEKGVVSKLDYLHAQRNANEIKSRILEKQENYHQAAWTDLNKNKAELLSITESLAALKDKMLRTTLYSPVSGIVKKIEVKTIGGVIQPGMNIMEIVPLEDTLLIKAYLKPTDIAFVHVGQPVTIKISAYDFSIYGSLRGKVEYVSPDAIVPEITTKNNDEPEANRKSYYEIKIRADKNYLGSEKYPLPIYPGMTATVHIVTGEKTLLDYFLKPLVKAKEEALRER